MDGRGFAVVSDNVTLLFYDRNGNRVDEGSTAAVVQYRSDDPARPDAPKKKRAAEPDAPEDTSKAITEPPADKAVKRSVAK